MQIGTIIRKYRLEKNLTQEEVARRLGVTAPRRKQVGEGQFHAGYHATFAHCAATGYHA